jgi:hypothetical protein
VKVLAIDPGPTKSAWCRYDGYTSRIEGFAHEPNEDLIYRLRHGFGDVDYLAIEMIASYGMAVGREVFETCVWIGRFSEAAIDKAEAKPVYRKDVKLHLCNSVKAKDANIRQALIDRFGGSNAIGKKAQPGVLYGIAGDVWSALAVAVTFADQQLSPV